MAIKIPHFSYRLTSLFKTEKAKPRHNFERLILAVHAVFSDSGFILSNDVICTDHPFHLRYSLTGVGPTAVVDFSVNDTVVNVTATLNGNTDGNATVYEARFDLDCLAGPLISCIHGAIGDSQEKVIAEFWREVISKLVDPLEIAVLLRLDSDSDGNAGSKPAPVPVILLDM